MNTNDPRQTIAERLKSARQHLNLKSKEFAAIATLIDDLQKQRDSLFRVSDQLAPDTPAPEVSRLMDERFEVEGLIRELKKQRDEAEEKFYQRKGRRK